MACWWFEIGDYRKHNIWYVSRGCWTFIYVLTPHFVGFLLVRSFSLLFQTHDLGTQNELCQFGRHRRVCEGTPHAWRERLEKLSPSFDHRSRCCVMYVLHFILNVRCCALTLPSVVKGILFIYCFSLRKSSSQVLVLWEDHRNDLFLNGFGQLTSAL
jgi:hypothetical protein